MKKMFLILFVLLTRISDVAGTETFTYDNLRRLTTRNGQTTASVGYSSMGNITSKTDAGTLDYNV